MSKTKLASFYHRIDLKKSDRQIRKFKNYPLPAFALGLDYLGLNSNNKISESRLRAYVNAWFKKPKRYLQPKTSWRDIKIKNKDGFLSFPSLLDSSRLTRFRYNPQPAGKPGRKVALIHVMHWNGRLKPYEHIINSIRDTALPISTLIHIPAGRGLNPGKDAPVDYASVSPNIGETIFRTRADIQDLQFIARALKEKMGYKEVGLFTYSIGSLRGIIASMMSPGLFDFGIFHMVADDFTAAIMKGVSTKNIAAQITGQIKNGLLRTLWSTISPGAYQKFFTRLPDHTRLVQCKYDFTFGPDNINNFNKKVLRSRPDIELEIVAASHTTLNHLPATARVMLHNLQYIYQNTSMKQYRRAAFFIKKPSRQPRTV